MDQKIAENMHRLKSHDARLYIKAGDNASEMADVPSETMQSWSLSRQPYLVAVEKKKWSLLRFPTSSAAQAAGMSTEAFQEFCFQVSCLSYAKMDRAMVPLVELMQKTDQVHSANGAITRNAPSLVDGATFENVCLTFEHGRIVSATGTPQDKLTTRLDTDEGARYLGEFALGVNPFITFPMKDILSDEKIAGSLHLTPGDAYEDFWDNGNRSAVHPVLIQTPEWGGGEIWFDGVLVRRDGSFALAELEGLNPENLV
ncbi:MAG: aminopeptidase [Thermoleophilia bacterium]|nr:aminopeptidase [Thermoleophilia bacterium]